MEKKEVRVHILDIEDVSILFQEDGDDSSIFYDCLTGYNMKLTTPNIVYGDSVALDVNFIHLF